MTLLFSHGNAEDIALHLPFVTAFAHRTGADVFSYEYVGYGPSRFKDCVPSERGCYRAINAAWDYLVAKGVEPSSIVVYGRSIGTGPSSRLSIASGSPRIAPPVAHRQRHPVRSGLRVLVGPETD